MVSPGSAFRKAVSEEKPLQVVGTICAYHALLAKRTGYKAIYLSGGGVAAGALGMPDLGISNLDDVLVDVRRITDVCDLPLLVDVDTGFGSSAFNVSRTTRSLIKAGAGAIVAGSAVFGSDDYAAAISRIRNCRAHANHPKAVAS